LEKDEELMSLIWTCEFCNGRNEVQLDDEEIPKSEEVTYLIEAAPAP